MNHIFKNSSFIIFILIGTCGYFFYQHVQEQKRQKIELNRVVDGCLEVLDNSFQKTNLLDEYIKRENFIRASVAQYLQINRDLEFDDSIAAIDLCPKMAEAWIRYEKPLFELVKEFNSTKMYDRQTFKDKSEFEWRIKTLEGLLELSDHMKNATKYTRDVLFEEVSKSKVSDFIKEQYHSNIQTLFVRSYSSPVLVNYRLAVISLKQYFQFLFENKEYFDFENDQIIFKNQVVMREHDKALRAMREHFSAFQKNLNEFE